MNGSASQPTGGSAANVASGRFRLAPGGLSGVFPPSLGGGHPQSSSAAPGSSGFIPLSWSPELTVEKGSVLSVL